MAGAEVGEKVSPPRLSLVVLVSIVKKAESASLNMQPTSPCPEIEDSPSHIFHAHANRHSARFTNL